MKKKILFLILCFTSFLYVNNVYAYVMIDNTGSQGVDQPVENYNAVMNPQTHYAGGLTNMGTSPWLYSISQFFYTAGSGNYLNVSADYYFLLSVNPGLGITDYLVNASRNTMQEANLRCGVGSNYRTGYDSTYIPEITQFSVTLQKYTDDVGYYSYRYRVRFNYIQQLSQKFAGSNVSCWFERIPDNGLFAQVTGGATNGMVSTFYYNNKLESSFSTNPIEGKLEDIQSGINSTNDKLDTQIWQNEQIYSEQVETNNKLDDLEDSITSEDAPNTGALADSAGWLPAGPVDSILNLPLTMFQNLSDNIGSSCSPLVINLPYVEKNITLPCLNAIYEQIEGLAVWINSIGIIASAFILYSYLLKLYKWVDDTLTFRENNHIDNWGGI